MSVHGKFCDNQIVAESVSNQMETCAHFYAVLPATEYQEMIPFEFIMPDARSVHESDQV